MAHQKFLTEAEVANILLLHEKGLCNSKIAEISGRSLTSVKRIISGKHFLQRPAQEEDTPPHDVENLDGTDTNVSDVMRDFILGKCAISASGFFMSMLIEWAKWCNVTIPICTRKEMNAIIHRYHMQYFYGMYGMHGAKKDIEISFVVVSGELRVYYEHELKTYSMHVKEKVCND